MATMKDVAKRAGVSLGTVSNVLNNRDWVLPENRERVLEAVRELDFHANMVARSLKTRSTKEIALIIPTIDNPFYPELARGVEDAANRAGYQVFLCNNDRTYKKELGYIRSLVSKSIDGLILVKPQISADEIKLLADRMAVVLVDADVPENPRCPLLRVADHEGFTMGMNLLYDYGHTKIALVNGLVESLSNYTRYQTYLHILDERGFPVREDYIIKGDYTWNSGYKAARTFMQLSDPPTAIFASNDLMAIGCMKALHELGISVPGDVSVLGYDNIDMAKLCTPTLTTVNQPKYDLGVRSVEMLLRGMEDRAAGATPESSGPVVLPTYLVMRESVGPVKE